MGRVDRFRQKRILRQRYFFSAIVFISLLTAGLCAADYTINNLLGGEKGLKIISMHNSSTSLEVFFMNQKLIFNTEYVNKDLDKLKHKLSELVGG